MEGKCETCRFWLRYEDNELGQCRRQPPEVVSIFNLSLLAQGRTNEIELWGHGQWPRTFPDDWCGEHRAAPPTTS